ncbi:MAG: glyceraldehyde-3-phosphate dehydrogenase, partial [Schleiferiaceae bacterium]|nr:glyceraldehyde-3-phosphate dehydrogenase [Schleiferiaceae bacterium]
MKPSANAYPSSVQARIALEKSAADLVNVASDLYYDRNVKVVLFRQALLDQRASEVLHIHEHAMVMAEERITVAESLAMAQAIYEFGVQNSSLDLGRLATEWCREAGSFLTRKAFLQHKLSGFTAGSNPAPKPVDVVLYGFGRIGRLVARELIAQEGRGEQLRLRAIVVRGGGAEDL